MDAAIAKLLNKDEEDGTLSFGATLILCMPLNLCWPAFQYCAVDDFIDAPSGDDSDSEESDVPSSDGEEDGNDDIEDDDDDDEEEDDDDGIHIDDPSSSEDEEDQGEDRIEKPRQPKGFIEGGKADTFARAFEKILQEQPKHSTEGAAPILAVRSCSTIGLLEIRISLWNCCTNPLFIHFFPSQWQASKSVAKRKAEDAADQKADKEAKLMRLAMKKQGHVIPKKRGEDPESDVREKALQKIATKGVVQLFNAVAKAQRRVKEATEATGNRAKAAKLGKASFLSELRNASKQADGGNNQGKQQRQSQQVGDDDAAEGENKGWDVLKESFTGLKSSGKMKDWDREDEDDDPSDGPEDLSDDDV